MVRLIWVLRSFIHSSVYQHSNRTQFAFPLPQIFFLLCTIIKFRMFTDNSQIKERKTVWEAAKEKKTKWLTIKCVIIKYIFQNEIFVVVFFFSLSNSSNEINICWFRHCYRNGFGVPRYKTELWQKSYW